MVLLRQRNLCSPGAEACEARLVCVHHPSSKREHSHERSAHLRRHCPLRWVRVFYNKYTRLAQLAVSQSGLPTELENRPVEIDTLRGYDDRMLASIARLASAVRQTSLLGNLDPKWAPMCGRRGGDGERVGGSLTVTATTVTVVALEWPTRR